MRAWWLLACGLIACVRSQAVTCADGTLCPEGFSCVVGGGCAAVGPCGDGVINLGEECDDANHASHDGCSSGCLIEQPTWTDASDPAGPTPRRGHAMAWFPDAGSGVLFGGTGEATLADTWLWTGHWTRATDGPRRTFAALADDGVDRLVLFGGADVTDVRLADTWTWDGTAWLQVATTGPSGRFGQTMARTANPGEVLMWGGDILGVPPVETWLWRAGSWTQGPDQVMAPDLRITYMPNDSFTAAAGSPQFVYTWRDDAWGMRESLLDRVLQVQDYDADRRTLVVFGGLNDTLVTNDIDEWDGFDWHRLKTGPTKPQARERAVGFFDPIRHGLVVFGGDAKATFLGDTWVLRWDSATPDDACDGTSDADGDGLVGCADPDCWARCQPHCPPGAPCDPAAPHCGDGACNPALETAALCPDDC